jgi:hypothetical protein
MTLRSTTKIILKSLDNEISRSINAHSESLLAEIKVKKRLELPVTGDNRFSRKLKTAKEALSRDKLVVVHTSNNTVCFMVFLKSLLPVDMFNIPRHTADFLLMKETAQFIRLVGGRFIEVDWPGVGAVCVLGYMHPIHKITPPIYSLTKPDGKAIMKTRNNVLIIKNKLDQSNTIAQQQAEEIEKLKVQVATTEAKVDMLLEKFDVFSKAILINNKLLGGS